MSATKTVSIYDNDFTISAPYVEGHTINAAEAKSLNQTRAENIANNFRKSVKTALENGGDLSAIRSEMAKYDAEYVFSMTSVRAPVDPVEKEAYNLAKRAIIDYLKEEGKGRKLKDIDPEKLEVQIDALMADPVIIDEAKKAVKAANKRADAVRNAAASTLGAAT